MIYLMSPDFYVRRYLKFEHVNGTTSLITGPYFYLSKGDTFQE
jgi:hypothetical protein